ncbi:MAG: hypothetical protein CNE95_02885 [Puniceicoccaceae bacterium MED-G30]|nr:MAG: hypothetical protein CNE95_02885 [Puniceicoccaceae bacterium MED-G30]|tara:strand:- start:10713 stop:11246 length:534 start_codon:yes stop_codon:yes gene_type:complete
MRLASQLLAILALIIPVSLQSDTLEKEDLTLQLRGSCRYLHHGIFKVYEASLLAPHDATTETLLSADCPFELHLHYLRDVKKTTVLRSANRMLEKNLLPAQLEAISERVTQLHDTYTEISKGDRAILRFHPKKGTTFIYNDEQRIQIRGKEFAKYYFSIWLGAKPVSPNMRDRLLNR